MSQYIRLFSSHGYGQVITIFTTLFLPAILIRNFGSGDYSIWVYANALSQFFLLSDFGLIYAFSNGLFLKDWSEKKDVYCFFEMVRYAVKKRLILSIFVSIVASAVTIFFLPSNVSLLSVFIVNLMLSMFAALTAYIALLTAVYRYGGKLEFGIFLQNTARFTDAIVVVLLSYFFDIELAVALTLLVKLIQIIWCDRKSVELMRSFCKCYDTHHSFNESKLDFIAKSAAGYAKLQFSQMISLHGITVFVAMKFTPEIAMIFNLSRTLTRLPIQPMTLINQTVAPSLTINYRDQKYQVYRRVSILLVMCSVCLTLIYLVMLNFNADKLFSLWLNKLINVDEVDLMLISVSSLLTVVSVTVISCQSAINNTEKQGNLSITLGIVLLSALALFPPSLGYKHFLAMVLVFDFFALIFLLFYFKSGGSKFR